MGFAFNPFTGNFDAKGSGGGGSSYIDGEVQNFSALPQTVGSPAVDSAYLVREAEGAWLLNRKPAGIYIRTANTGVRASDWTYAGEFPDVFNDANLVVYNNTDSTKNFKFDASAIATATTRTITVPNKNVTLDDAGDSRTPTAHAAAHASAGSDPLELINLAATGTGEGELAVTQGDGTVAWQNGTTWASLNITAQDIGAAPASHTHAASDITSGSFGNISHDGKVGTDSGRVLVTTTAGAVTTLALGTAGQVLTVNSGATGVEFAAASGGGVSAVNSTLADILSVSGSDLVADDLGADKLYGFDDSEGKAIGFTIGSGLSVSGDTISATASGGSKTYAVFSAYNDSMPPSSNYATLDTRNNIGVADYDDATDESLFFMGIIPEGASLGSGLKIRLHWMATTATSGNVVWDVSLERMTTDLDADSFDTIASGTAAANGTSGILTVTEITLTTIDSVTAGDGYRLKVTRDANNASDTMTGDAELVAVEVRSAA